MRRSASLLNSTARAPHLVIAALAIFLTATPAHADFDCQIAKLLASDGAESDHFGDFVAISGITAIVGAPLHDHNSADAGSAYIFRKNGDGDWFEIDEITTTDAEAGDLFGFRSLSGHIMQERGFTCVS